MYLTGETKAPLSNLAIHAETLRTRGKWVPVMIDLEGRKRGKDRRYLKWRSLWRS